MEGSHCLQEACARQMELKAIVASHSYMDAGIDELNQLDISDISVVDDQLFNELVTTTSSCGVVAIAQIPAENKADLANWNPRVILVVDAIQDPGNLGTLFRSALAAELGGIVLMKGSVDPYNPKVVRAAAGALFEMPFISNIIPEELVDLLRANQYRLIACEARASRPYFDCDLSDGVALILGNEGQGVDPALLDFADERISIPMNPRSESLNVAISGGIILFETHRQRLLQATKQ